MSPMLPGGAPQTTITDDDAIRSWIDSLSSGRCNEAAFLQAMQQRFASHPDANWEVLSQLDQHYRRGRIAAETFKTIKTALAEAALGLAAPIAAQQSEPRIPIAHDVVVAPRVERTDVHQRREEPQSVEAAGEPKPGGVLRRRYRLEALLGQGEMGPVFQALDEYRLDSPGSQRLAIKILHPAAVKRAELLAELRREFQSLQLLSHPNIVRVFEFDRDGALVFFTMELLNGATLSRVLQARKLAPLPVDQAFAAVRDIGAALAYAHSRGVVHGDLTPQNIFLTASGELRLLGFARSHKLEGELPDARDDIFALACIAYLLLSGEHPLQGKTAIEARDARLTLRRPAQLNHRQWRALRAGLGWERKSRPGDLCPWLEQLELRGAARRLPTLTDLLEPPPRVKQKSSWPAIVIAAAAVIAAALWFVSQRGMLPRLGAPLSLAAPAEAPEPTPPVIAPDASVPTAPPVAVAATPVAPSVAAPATAKPIVAARAASTSPLTPPPAAGSPPTSAAGSSRVELAADTVDVPMGETSAQISVHRKGSLRGETTFTWWTESGTAKPGADFTAVMPQSVHIGDGKSTVTLTVALSKAPHAQPKSFYVVIDQSEGGAALGPRTLTMVTLQAAE